MDSAGLQSLTVFLRVAQARSFSAAAQNLGLSTSGVSYTIRQLETALGGRLFNRTTRSVSLTEAGESLLNQITPLMEDLQLALGKVSRASMESMGTLRLNVPSAASDYIIRPMLQRFLTTYPDINIEVAVDNSLVDIASQGFDAGIRYDNILTDDMVAVPLITNMRFAVVAAPDYVARHGLPQHPQDLLAHACVNYRSAQSGALYRWEFERGDEKMRVAVNGRVATNDPELICKAALDGFGFAYLHEEHVAGAIARGELVRVLTDWMPSTGLYLYYYSRKDMPKKLRVFIDFARAFLAASPMPAR
ncbi:LysR family transcriptional regulator [Alcaligenaceae bacterium B3P038]|nr:LysR family transcriptional regulator [Alcaligenaceae bacterium B3P038]